MDLEIHEKLQEAEVYIKRQQEEIERLNEYIGKQEHEKQLLYGRLNNIISLASKEIK